MNHPVLVALSGVPSIFAIIAQAVSASHEVTPFLTTGAVGLLVGALVYVANQFSKGNIVSRRTAETEERLQDHILKQEVHAKHMEVWAARTVELAERAEEREKRAERREIIMLEHVLGQQVEEVS